MSEKNVKNVQNKSILYTKKIFDWRGCVVYKNLITKIYNYFTNLT